MESEICGLGDDATAGSTHLLVVVGQMVPLVARTPKLGLNLQLNDESLHSWQHGLVSSEPLTFGLSSSLFFSFLLAYLRIGIR